MNKKEWEETEIAKISCLVPFINLGVLLLGEKGKKMWSRVMAYFDFSVLLEF